MTLSTSRFPNLGTTDILSQTILCWGSWGSAVPCRVFSRIPGLQPLAASSTQPHPQARQPKVSPEIAKWPLGDKTTSLRIAGLEVKQLIVRDGEGT